MNQRDKRKRNKNQPISNQTGVPKEITTFA